MAWFIILELLQDPATTIAEWLEALQQLEMQVFLAGYELEELVREKE